MDLYAFPKLSAKYRQAIEDYVTKEGDTLSQRRRARSGKEASDRDVRAGRKHEGGRASPGQAAQEQ